MIQAWKCHFRACRRQWLCPRSPPWDLGWECLPSSAVWAWNSPVPTLCRYFHAHLNNKSSNKKYKKISILGLDPTIGSPCILDALKWLLWPFYTLMHPFKFLCNLYLFLMVRHLPTWYFERGTDWRLLPTWCIQEGFRWAISAHSIIQEIYRIMQPGSSLGWSLCIIFYIYIYWSATHALLPLKNSFLYHWMLSSLHP